MDKVSYRRCCLCHRPTSSVLIVALEPAAPSLDPQGLRGEAVCVACARQHAPMLLARLEVVLREREEAAFKTWRAELAIHVEKALREEGEA